MIYLDIDLIFQSQPSSARQLSNSISRAAERNSSWPMFTYLDHAVINWAILHEALIVIVKKRFIKVYLEVNFYLERLQTWNLLNFESSNELTWAYMIYEQIEQTFWNPFWKAYPKTMTIQRVSCLWVSDINGNWIWTRSTWRTSPCAGWIWCNRDTTQHIG